MKSVVLASLQSPFNLYEEFGAILPLVRPFFVGGGSHCATVEVGDDIRDRIFMYTATGFPCAGCTRKTETITLEYGKTIPNVFFDKEVGEGCVRIEVGNRFAGSYCSYFNVLSLTDWTHDRDTVEVARELVPILIKKLGLGAIKKSASKRKKVKVEVTVGADPEFEELEVADRYVPVATSYRGASPTCEIGADGAGYQIELRPRPGKNSLEIVRNIKNLIKQIRVPLSVKGDRYPLGAHIHFGIPNKFRNEVRTLVQVLDDFLGKRLLDVSGRARGSYKVLGAYETKPWGFEYRSLPSAYLLDPAIARVVFKIARRVVKTLLEKGKIFYCEVPEKRDYIRLAGLTEREWEIFNNFVENYNSYSGFAINKNWGAKIRKIRESFVLRINFSDDWSDRIRAIFDRELQKRRRWFKKRNVNSIVLYGLRQSRGNVVAGFDCIGYTRIEHPLGRDYENRYYFGLPYGLRLSGAEGEIKKVVLYILKAVNRLSRANSATGELAEPVAME